MSYLIAGKIYVDTEGGCEQCRFYNLNDLKKHVCRLYLQNLHEEDGKLLRCDDCVEAEREWLVIPERLSLSGVKNILKRAIRLINPVVEEHGFPVYDDDIEAYIEYYGEEYVPEVREYSRRLAECYHDDKPLREMYLRMKSEYPSIFYKLEGNCDD